MPVTETQGRGYGNGAQSGPVGMVIKFKGSIVLHQGWKMESEKS
jgi:hypothetical protein